MKKLLALVVLSGLILAGCKDSNLDPVSPQNGNISFSNLPANQPTTLDKLDFSSLKLNKWRGLYGVLNRLSLRSVIIRNTINGLNGGNINLYKFFTSTSHGKVATVNATINFGRNAFSGNQDIYMIVDPDNASISFYPSIEQFNNTVTLDASINGIDVSNLPSDPSNINFVYFPDDAASPVQVIANNGISLDSNTGTVSVKGAQLKHFSRYGWATKDGDSTP